MMAQKLNSGGSGSRIAEELDFQIVADESGFQLQGSGEDRN